MGRRRKPAELTSVEHRQRSDPLGGWRYWQLEPATGLLRSVTHRRFAWRPGEPMRAVCLIGGHSAPAPGCACGVHATPDLAALRAQSLCLAPADPLVAGEASLWGTVVVDDHGLRAEYACPSRLLLVTPEGDEPDAAAMAHLAAYGVPVAVVAPREAVGEVAAAIMAFQAISR